MAANTISKGYSAKVTCYYLYKTIQEKIVLFIGIISSSVTK